MLTIVRGRTWNFDATIFDVYLGEDNPGNEPTNHTGWTIRSQIRKKVGNVLVANLNVTFPVPTAGTVAIRHDRDFTRSLPVGDYWWDIVATDPSGLDHDYIEAEPIAVHDHPTDPANSTYDFVPGGGGAIYHTHVISNITGLQALLDDRLPPDGGTIARYLRGDNTWQLLNKAAVGLGNVENTKLSTWTGSSNITQLGTIISGSWQGSRIAPQYLGDGTSIETKFLRGDGTWQTVSGGGGAYIDLSDATTVNLPSVNTPLATALSGKAPASGISPSAISGTAVITTDARLSDARTPTAHTHPASEISDSTVTGRSILTAANQSAARTSGLGAGATGNALFTAATPAAARTTLELGETNTPTFGGLDLLTAGTTTLNVYNSLSGANFERLSFRWASNIARIGTAKGGTGTARDLALETDGTERVRVLSTGSVGIGTTAPTAALHVVKGATSTLTSIFANPAGDVFNQFAAQSGTGEYGVWQDALYFQALASLGNGIRFFIGSTNALQIAAPSGNVGIGAPTPASKLTVTGGDAEVTDATNGLILKTPDGTKRYRVTIDNAGALTTTLL